MAPPTEWRRLRRPTSAAPFFFLPSTSRLFLVAGHHEDDSPRGAFDDGGAALHDDQAEALLETIESVGAFVNTEILVRARAAGFRIRQVPVTHHPRKSGRQTGAHPRVIFQALSELVGLYGTLGQAARAPRHD